MGLKLPFQADKVAFGNFLIGQYRANLRDDGGQLDALRAGRPFSTNGGHRPECPYMDSSSLQASFALAPVPTAHVYSASDFGIDSMLGHDGLFARR
ncbi:hypothetical protein, partial [Pseudomonas sp.]|uniref:hypothetical protein n=1 Tax=Pseudomonas sp. TaxID=306 RepID=UPI00286C401C